MHDPQTQAFDIKYPWWRKSKFGKFHDSFITIWHVDPEKDNTDDSCGWFPRSRHGDKAVLAKIEKRFEEDWDREYVSEGKRYYRGYFYPQDSGAGMPNMSTQGIALNLFFMAAFEHYEHNRSKAMRFMKRNLFEIMLLTENPTDSIRDSIVRTFGQESNRAYRISDLASIIYGWILRNTRPWYRHPRWHVWHWRVQIHPLQNLKRRYWDKCCKCGKRGFKKGSAISDWNGTRIWHDDCNNQGKTCQVVQDKPVSN